MRQPPQTIAGVGLLLGCAIALVPSTAIARTCSATSQIPPSSQMREFRIEQFDLTLMIPDNYRSMLRSSGHITFHDPRSFELIQCLVRTGAYAEVPPYPALEVYQGINPQSDLVAIVRMKRPWLDYYNPDYQLIEFAGQAGLQYEYTNNIYQQRISNISFLSADGSMLLTLTGPTDHPIMVNALATLVSDSQN